jgi:hypothetical protein
VNLISGFAVASTDTGHERGDTAWMQLPDKVTDFAGRAMHETTVAGKAVTAWSRAFRLLFEAVVSKLMLPIPA